MPDSTNFAPRSFFFTDPVAITQTQAQAFGPVDENRFRTTASFSVAADSPAYAVCTGTVLVQPQTADGSRVNLILRPFKQPIQGLNIRYFVYRGLDISGFFSDGNVLPATESTSDFVNSVNTAFADYYHRVSPGTALPEFKASFIGYDPQQQPDNTLLSDLFFKRSTITGEGTDTDEQSPFELPLVQEGSSLGNFKAGECGFEVVLSYGDYKLPEPNDEFRFDLAYARAAANTIDVTSETDDFKKKRTREQITQFIDAAAYYGFHYREDGAVDIKSNAGKTTKKGEQIYNDVIINFYTRNNLYLYIQSDRGRSYNFYGNYKIDDSGNNSLGYGLHASAIVEREYGTMEWPIIVENGTQSRLDDAGKIYLSFATDNNKLTVLYGQVSEIDVEHDGNFLDVEYLKSKGENIRTDLTKVIPITSSFIKQNANYFFVASFNLIIYQGKIYNFLAGNDTDGNGVIYDVFYPRSVYDDLFARINAVPFILNNKISGSGVVEDLRIKLLCRIEGSDTVGITAFQTSKIKDSIIVSESETLERVTFVTESVDVETNVIAPRGAISQTNNTKSDLIVFEQGTYQLPFPFFQLIKLFTDESITISGVKIGTFDNSIPNIILFGITFDQYNLIENLVIGNSVLNACLHLRDFYENSESILTKDIAFRKFKLGVSGEVNGLLRVFLPEIDIIVYSLDGNSFCSSEYSRYMTNSNNGNLVPITKNNLDLAQ